MASLECLPINGGSYLLELLSLPESASDNLYLIPLASLLAVDIHCTALDKVLRLDPIATSIHNQSPVDEVDHIFLDLNLSINH